MKNYYRILWVVTLFALAVCLYVIYSQHNKIKELSQNNNNEDWRKITHRALDLTEKAIEKPIIIQQSQNQLIQS